LREFTELEQANLESLKWGGHDFAVLELTETGARKSILDATRELRAFLIRQSIHDYSAQGRGTESKVLFDAQLLLPRGEPVASRASLIRPNSGNGDPRIWFRRLPLLCDPWQKFVIMWSGGQFQLHNISEAKLSVDGFANETFEIGLETGDRWSALGALWERATGGRGVAARPIDDVDEWPVARRAAGVDEAIEWLKESFEFSGVSRLVFLVGGPGAGKSHAAAALVDGQVRIGTQNDELAQRTYRYQCAARELVLVNDATISSDEYAFGALSQETECAIKTGQAFMACVNRGVLLEETLRSPAESLIGTHVINWIYSVEGYEEPLLNIDEQEGPVIITDVDVTYFRTGRVMVAEKVLAEIVVVFVDACSLLEPSPEVRTESGLAHGGSWFAKDYRVSDLTTRFGIVPNGTPAGDLLSRVIGKFNVPALPGELDLRTEGSGLLDPFAANLSSLASAAVQSGLLTILRSTEIVTGTGFTFREIWGAIARVMVGNATEREVAGNARKLIEKLQPTTDEPLERFAQIQRLAELRFSQSLYGVGKDDPTAPPEPAANPVTRLTHNVDPVRDSTPGYFLQSTPNAGWATPIIEAFSGPVTSGSPLETLCASLQPEDPFHEVIDKFDWEIDHAFVAASSAEKLADVPRNKMIAWYGRYITRLYATANGIPAFRREVALWTLAWKMSPAIPSGLEECIRTLLRPPRGHGAASMIPVFDSRTTPIIGTVSDALIALETNAFGVHSSSSGEGLFLSVTEDGVTSPRMLLDFSLVRQALSCTAGWIGFTEVSDDTSPRLERFRSSRLVPNQLGQSPTFVVLEGSKNFTVQVGRS
jgi:hypothetical protein